MSVEDSVARWVDGLRASDEESARVLWRRYFERLVRLAGSKLPPGTRREFDEEDVALSAFRSLCDGVRAGRFPDLDDPDNLWALLVVITGSKVSNRLRAQRARKRGGGLVRGDSGFRGPGGDADAVAIEQVVGREPTADFAAEVAEDCERLLAELPTDDLREVALMKMAGHTSEEIADRTGSSRRTVSRRLGLIRRAWAAHAEGPVDDA